MSPVAMCGIPYSAEIRLAWVPFPDPCGPSNRTFTSAQKTFVGAHHHLRLHLAHRVERDTDDDQHRGAAEGARRRLREPAVANEEAREGSDTGQGEGSPEWQPW